MDWNAFLSRFGDLLARSSPWQLKFARDVLTRVEGLNPAHVAVEKSFVDSTGRPRRMDFAIEDECVRIAIEVDGYDKTGRGTGMTGNEFHDWSLREVDLVSQGWRVLRFANTLFAREPEHCRHAIEATLAIERGLCEERRQARQEQAGLESKLAEVGHESVELQRQLGEARARLARVETAIRTKQLEDIPEKVAQRAEVDVGELERLRIENMAAIQRSEKAERRVLGMRSFVIALAVFAAGVAATTYFLTRPPGDLCEGEVSWQKASGCIGEADTSLKGPVVRVEQEPSIPGSPTFIDIGETYPDKERLSVVVWGDDRGKFPPLRQFLGEDVCIHGVVEFFEGVPQIELQNPSNFRSC